MDGAQGRLGAVLLAAAVLAGLLGYTRVSAALLYMLLVLVAATMAGVERRPISDTNISE